MLASSSILSRFASRLFGPRASRRRIRRSDLRQRQHAPVVYAAEVMEERALLSATFGAALSIGNDTGSTNAWDVATDTAGNSYVTGWFTGTVDFDQAAAHAGDTDILASRSGSRDSFVAKYAPDNALVWVERMGGDADGDIGRSITLDGNGNVYVSGMFQGSADFGSTTLTTTGDTDGFVAKLDAGGTVQWAQRWGTAVSDDSLGIGVDASGNVYALGYRSGGGHDILKFSSTGSTVWSQSIASNSFVSTGDLSVDATGNVFVTGTFHGTVDFDPSSKTKLVSSGPDGGMGAGFVLKLDTKGKFGWVSPFVSQSAGSTSSYSWSQSVALDNSGNVIVGGLYSNTVDFNPGTGTTTLPTTGGGFITKLNSSGGLVWARALESSGGAAVRSLGVDSAGSVYATGYFSNTIDLNPGASIDVRTSAGEQDIFVVKLTAAGNYSWAETFGGTGSDYGLGLAVDPTGGVHLVGFFAGTVDFDSDPLSTYYLTNPGTYKNAYRLRLRQV